MESLSKHLEMKEEEEERMNKTLGKLQVDDEIRYGNADDKKVTREQNKIVKKEAKEKKKEEKKLR